MESETKKTIADSEQRRAQAILQEDYPTFLNLAHRDLRYVHSSGAIDSLESYITNCKSGFYQYQRMELPIDEIVIAGGTAVVYGRMEATVLVSGKVKYLDYPSISIWTFTNKEGWKFLSFSPRA